MEAQSRNALKVGILMLIWLVILVAVVLSITDQRLGQRGYTFTATFANAQGVSKGAPVQYAGVDVGEVKSVQLVQQADSELPAVDVIIWLPADVQVHHDVKAEISTFGLLGEKYVELTSVEGAGGVVQVGERIRGIETDSLTVILQQSSVALTKLNTLLTQLTEGEGTLGKLVATDELHQRLVELIQETKAVVVEIKRNPWKLLRRSSEKDNKQNARPGATNFSPGSRR